MKPKLLFVTDPLCSWCWGTLPEFNLAREQLKDRVEFDLLMGGLQIGPADGLLEYDKKRLQRLWREVAEVTGQRFSQKVPPDFIYHSEISCRAVEIARKKHGAPPFEFFHKLQRAFYLQGQNINDVNVLANLLEMNEWEVRDELQTESIIAATRANFSQARALSANALPNVMLDVGAGYKLVCGGYVTTDYLIPDIVSRINPVSD